jgi:hypothetical protein
VNLHLSFYGPSSTSPGPGFAPVYPVVTPTNVQTVWDVPNGTTTNFAATYFAPRCAPRRLVEIKVWVGTYDHGQVVAHTEVTAKIRVIPQVWAIDVFYRLRTTCGGPPWSVDFCRSHEFSLFRLRNLQVISFRGGPENNETTQPSHWCPGFNGGGVCSEPTLSTISDLMLTNVTGSVLGSFTVDPVFELTLSADVPGHGARLTFTCGGQAVAPQPIMHGAGDHETGTVLINYADLKTYLVFNPAPATDEEVEIVLRPVDCNGVAAPGPSSCH